MRRKALAFVATVAAIGGVGVAIAQISSGVPAAQPRSGSPANVLASGFTQTVLARGTDALENPTNLIRKYGQLNDSTTAGGSGFATTTEPDINTYLKTTTNPGGPEGGFDYGRNFLFQGHENGNNNAGGSANAAYLTRINLDVPVTDVGHRITLLSPDSTQAVGTNLVSTTPGNTGLTRIDGSGFDPFNGEVLFTAESNNTTGGVYASTLAWTGTTPPQVKEYASSMGRGGYEGIHPDSNGNVYIVEDGGGSTFPNPVTAVNNKAKQPNSFVYRFVPVASNDLSTGKLQALQVSTSVAGVPTPVKFHTGDPGSADTYGQPILDIHSGTSQSAQWVTVHDTQNSPSNWGNVVDAMGNPTGAACAVSDANCAAKSAGATPFKRPENGNFVPGSGFTKFVFTETGDTDATAGNDPAAAARGAWGALVQIDLPTAGATTGLTVKTIELGDGTHAGFDNITFLDATTIIAGEDRGETLHSQATPGAATALDSLWSFDTTKSFATINADAKRLLAQGRDATATASAARVAPDCTAATPAPKRNGCAGATAPFFQNDGDNETTGIIVSDGAVTTANLLGTTVPTAATSRIFYTQQHGDNITYEIRRAAPGGGGSTTTTTTAPAPTPTPATTTTPVATTPAVPSQTGPNRSNDFTVSFGSTRISGRTLTFSVSVPGPGDVAGKIYANFSGSGARAAALKLVSSAKTKAAGKGRVSLRFELSKKTRKAIKRKGQVKGSLRVKFTPTGGTPRTTDTPFSLRGA